MPPTHAPVAVTPEVTAGPNVLIIGPDHPDLLGHAAKTLDIARHLAITSAEVTLLTGASRPEGDPGAATVVRLQQGDHRSLASMTMPARAARHASRLAAAACAATRNRPDLIIATCPPLAAVLAAARLARRHEAPLLVLVHDLIGTAPGSAPLSGALERRAFAAADLVAVGSATLVAPLIEYGVAPERITTLPGWSDDGETPTRRASRMLLGWPARGVQVVATDVGHGQDLTTVVEAARLLAGRDGLRFTVIGESAQRCGLGRQIGQLGGLTRRTRRAATPAVQRVEDLSPAHLRAASSAADLFVLAPSPKQATARGVPQALLTRYLSAGRPVVLCADQDSECAAMARDTAGAVTVIPPGDPAALAETLVGLASNEALRRLMAERAKTFSRSTLDPAAAMVALDGIVSSTLAGPGPKSVMNLS